RLVVPRQQRNYVRDSGYQRLDGGALIVSPSNRVIVTAMSNQPSLPLAVPSAPAPARAMPHNLEAEQALLGAILFDNETYNRINPLLQEKHFFDPVHGRIFRACTEMIAAGDLADGVTLKERFARDGGIKEIGGAVYLLKLMEAAAPLSAQAQSYADLIYDLAL